MLVPLGFRHHFLNHYIDHGAGRKGQGVGQYGLKHQHSCGTHHAGNGFYDGAQLTKEERLPAGNARPTKGHAHGYALREILKADANGQCHGGPQFSTVEPSSGGAEGHTHGQPLRDVV